MIWWGGAKAMASKYVGAMVTLPRYTEIVKDLKDFQEMDVDLKNNIFNE